MYRINRFIKLLAGRQWRETIELPEWEMRKARYILPGSYEYESERHELQPLEPLNSRQGVTYFLRKRLTVPPAWSGCDYGLVVDGGGGGEGLLRIDGVSYHGLDRNHTYVPLHLEDVGGEPLLEIELYDPIPEPADPLNAQATINPPMPYLRIMLVLVDKPVQSLLYCVQAACEAILLLPERDMKRLKIRDALHEAMDEAERMWSIGDRGAEGCSRSKDERCDWITALEVKLKHAARVNAGVSAANGKMHMVGQSHIDIAWLWPVRETVRKVSRTFSTMNTLMKEYPDFIYTQSQPLLYAFVKEHDPELFGQIKRRVAEGRWELVGGMWVEPDLNIPSGESLVRQMLHGQLFYKEEFGRTSSIEWLPDTFGYCASLPQLLKLAGVDYFMTTKLNWNDTNLFPYDLFNWVGIDGTSVVSYLNHGLNEHTRPKDVHEHWEAFRQKDKLDELMLLYGHGDGGGGVTREMLELVDRSSLMAGLPESRFSTAASFFKQVAKRRHALPKWHGDLYLELHRGTYTTHARNKRSNRMAEVLYREAELWSCLAGPMLGKERAERIKQALHEGWKLILLNQFHDIIPGTAITETYVTSSEEYERVFAVGQACLGEALRAVSVAVGRGDREDRHVRDDIPYIVFNSLGWERSEIITIEIEADGKRWTAYEDSGMLLETDMQQGNGAEGKSLLTVHVQNIPAFGYSTIWLRASERPETAAGEWAALGYDWETGHYRLGFNETGEIVSWYDKKAERELIASGKKANELQLFIDKPLSWDAWDIDPRFESQRSDSAKLLSKSALPGRTRDVLRFKWLLGSSVVEQDIVFYPDKKRVDFQTRVDWKEEHKLLKVAFPVDIVAGKATYEIPFGALERPTHTNTSWEQAQYEVCGYRWADLSEGGFGVSLLNDCKYGYDIKGTTMRLSLLRAPRWPDMTADQGVHEFTYSLLPHEGDWRTSHVVRRAAELNHPVRVLEGHTAEKRESAALPFRSGMLSFDGRHVLLDTVKPAERGEGIIYRFYESAGARERVTLRLPSGASKACVVNLLEEKLEELEPQGGEVMLSFRPFEIKSLRVE